MKRISAFLKATTLGGLFILLPLMIVLGVAVRVVAGVREATEAVMKKMTGEGSFADEFPLLVAILIVVGVSFFLGLGMVSRRGQNVGGWVERTLLFRLPGYAAMKAILSGFSDMEEEGAVKVGLFSVDDHVKCIVFVMEAHEDGWLTVFVPETPNPASGTVQFVREDRVRRLPLKLHEVGPLLQHWGVGMKGVLAKSGGLASLSGDSGAGESSSLRRGGEIPKSGTVFDS